ncbi:hypothetical protein [Teichococcus aestuarii]|uniref:hypothetical protein n=1 Tax=Teichococcus aestuarii TaxID=568898 RepID=UPI00361CA7B8
MQINRRGPGEASLTQDGRDLLDLLAVEASDEEFDAFLARLEQCLALREDMPRIAVTYREGLLGGGGGPASAARRRRGRSA